VLEEHIDAGDTVQQLTGTLAFEIRRALEDVFDLFRA
jgi:hypothetical protein